MRPAHRRAAAPGRSRRRGGRTRRASRPGRGPPRPDRGMAWSGSWSIPLGVRTEPRHRQATGRLRPPARSAAGHRRLGDVLEDIARLLTVATLGRQVAERYDADEPLVAVQDE